MGATLRRALEAMKTIGQLAGIGISFLKANRGPHGVCFEDPVTASITLSGESTLRFPGASRRFPFRGARGNRGSERG